MKITRGCVVWIVLIVISNGWWAYVLYWLNHTTDEARHRYDEVENVLCDVVPAVPSFSESDLFERSMEFSHSWVLEIEEVSAGKFHLKLLDGVCE